jgi:transcriptional regulator with XRE-family HTH domain
MLSETLVNGLGHYKIGPKLRRLRLKKSMGLVKLGEHTGLSPALLSKIERGQIFPTLPTLLRIAMVFGLGLEHFFVESTPHPLFHVVRKSERLAMPDQPGVDTPAYLFESLDFPVSNRKMESYVAEFPLGGPPSRPHHHTGVELIYVIKGQLKIDFEDETVTLEEGDAATFEGAIPHSYARAGRGAASAVVTVVTA